MAWQKEGFVFQERRVNMDHDYAPRVLKKTQNYTETKRVMREKISDTFPSQVESLFPRRDPNLLLSGGGNQGYGHKGFTSKGVQTSWQRGSSSSLGVRLPRGKRLRYPQDKRRSWTLLRETTLNEQQEMKHMYVFYVQISKFMSLKSIRADSGEFKCQIYCYIL